MIKTIDRFLDHLTMYRLILYYLMTLVGTAFVFGFERRASSTRRAVPAYELSATRRPALRSKAASASVGPLVTS